MVLLEIVGGLAVLSVGAVGVWFLFNNVSINTQKGRKK